jgi:hypothetical protein
MSKDVYENFLQNNWVISEASQPYKQQMSSLEDCGNFVPSCSADGDSRGKSGWFQYKLDTDDGKAYYIYGWRTSPSQWTWLKLDTEGYELVNSYENATRFYKEPENQAAPNQNVR